MRLALVHDHLCGIGGSERIFQHLCEEFQEADIYTLAYNPKTTLPYFATRKIHTTWLNRFVSNSDAFRWSFPLATYVMQRVDLSNYDIVLSSSATTAKYVKAPKGGHICYCYIPTRALWHYEQYFGISFKRYLVRPFLNLLKNRDYRIAQEVDRFISISESSKQYIQQYYNQAAETVYCPVETEKFTPTEKKLDHYLLVSRLEPWKKVEYAIEAFNRLGKPLKIVGTGTETVKLRKMARENVSFLGSLDDIQLAKEYSACKAVIFTPFLEYGLIPLEANASGTPVICYGHGGVNETMIPAETHSKRPPTALFFYEQTASALIDAVEKFETMHFDHSALVEHAAQWNVASFKKKMRTVVEQQSKRKKTSEVSGLIKH